VIRVGERCRSQRGVGRLSKRVTQSSGRDKRVWVVVVVQAGGGGEGGGRQET